ncbi:Dynactin subunit 4 [Psilocybe cubensis]|uniref:Dynactin subunit 4 n=1 Tax=Psilocybe cubensis TaxID=181762 RepID=A0ACB8GJW1_PSICU|nr:Dynactin subunit 4 [Psilocybe cubensis]KAH9475971.1 Dynactin subunit 4 [Psilocybe cubensis]
MVFQAYAEAYRFGAERPAHNSPDVLFWLRIHKDLGGILLVTASVLGTGGGEADGWVNSWVTPLQTSELKPLRIPLHSQRSKRCPACTHILIKPEQKAQSVLYKIKLVAANYLPAITVSLPPAQRLTAEAAKKSLGRSVSTAVENSNAGAMHAGRTYPFHLALSNSLCTNPTDVIS